MDALAVEQYRYLLAVLLGGLAAGGVVLAWQWHRRRPAEPSAGPVGGGRSLLPHMMLVLVSMTVGVGLLLLLPAGMILRYFPHWQLAAMLAATALLLAAPLACAWRGRPT